MKKDAILARFFTSRRVAAILLFKITAATYQIGIGKAIFYYEKQFYVFFLTWGSFDTLNITLKKSFFYSIFSLLRHIFDQIYDLL